MTATLNPPPVVPRPSAPEPSPIGNFLMNPPPHPIRRLIGILRLEPKALVWIFVGTVMASLVSLGQPLLAGSIVGGLQGGDFSAALPFGAALAGLAMLTSGITAGVNVISAQAGNRAVRTFRDESAAMALRVPADRLVDHPTADLVARCSIDSEHLNQVFTRGPVQALGGVVLVVGALIQMTVLDPTLTIAALALTLGCLALIVVVSKRLTGMTFVRQEAQGAYVAEVTRALDSVLTLRAFVADQFANRRLSTSSEKLLDASNRADRAHAFMGPIIAIAIQATLLLIVVVAVLRVQAGELSVEQLVSFFMYTMLIIGPIIGSTDTVMEMAETLGALQRLVDMRTVTATKHAPTLPLGAADSFFGAKVRGEEPPDVLQGRVEFRDVSVRYPHSEGGREHALDGVSFSVPAGSWVALTGSSGSGKSTALSILEKFVKPSSGVVLVDDIPLFEHVDDDYRRQVGFIEQSCPLFSGTVRDNLLLGRQISDEQCWDIIERVGLMETIASRGKGLDAPVGESAYAFSGGERQRLAIARTLIGRPKMLLLDEITSGLDVVNRHQIMRLIKETMGGVTTFASGHGHFGMDEADLVLVLDQGKLVEFGAPAQVRRRSALFRSLIAH